MFISCWHKNDVESAAMWKLYLKSDEDVAISTAVDRLATSFLETTYSIFIGDVEYVDYERDVIGDEQVLRPFLTKRTSFSHEREVRSIISPLFRDPLDKDAAQQEPSGIALAVDLSRLIENVYVAPGTQDWVRDAVQSVLQKFGISHVVRRSSLSDDPVF